MKTICVIPSRWGSTRFPGKSLHPICGKPLVQWVVEACRRARLPDETVVATDDTRIADAVAAFGGKAVMTRPDHPSGTDRVAEAANAADGDIVINVQGDEPMIDPALIDTLAEKMRSGASWDMATAVSPLKSADDLAAKSVVKVVTARDGAAMYFSRLPIPCNRDTSPDLESGLYVRHLGIYAYRGAFLKRLVAEKPCALEQAEKLEQLRALWIGGRIATVRVDDPAVGVDTPQDAERIEKIMKERGMA